MNNHFRDIGFDIIEDEDYFNFIDRILVDQVEEVNLTAGKAAVYKQANGLQYWFQRDENGKIIDTNFHFASPLRNTIRIEKCLESNSQWRSGLFACSIELDEGDGYTIPEVPINLNAPVVLDGGSAIPGRTYLAQIACYAEHVEVYQASSPDNARGLSETNLPNITFIPCGTFGLPGDEAFEPSPRAIISGFVEYAERLTNEDSGLAFDHVQICCVGVWFDLLIATTMYESLPRIGEIVGGMFWMSAALWEAPVSSAAE